MNQLNIKSLTSGGVITTYACVSRCGHCLYNCGPHRARDYLDGEQAEAIFRRIAGLGCHSVHIGGGEPLLDLQKLTEVMAAARRVGVGIEYVETNSVRMGRPRIRIHAPARRLPQPLRPVHRHPPVSGAGGPQAFSRTGPVGLLR